VRISVQADIRGALESLRHFRRDQIPFATSLALNTTARDAQAALKREITRVFDSPTKFVQNSPRITPSTKANLNASVFIGDSVARSIRAQVRGGTRLQKPYETRLRHILPAGWVTVPGKGAKIDGNGNMNRTQLLQILRTIRGSKRSSGDYFVSTPEQPARTDKGGRLPYGIWQRVGRGRIKRIVNVLFFLPRAAYPERFRFFEIAEKTVRQKIAPNFRAAMARAMATAR
jgi:hypothetical protein